MDLPVSRRREAAAVGTFGAVFLLVFVVGLLVAGLAFARAE